MIQADLHVHTTFSSDSSIQPKTLIQQLVTHDFIKVAAITDHDTTQGINTIRQLAAAYSDILIIPGVEISTPNGDILLLGTEETPPKPWIPTNIIDFAKDNDYVSIVAHPYREYGMGDLAKNFKFDAVEVFNGCSAPTANKQAHDLAKLMNLPGVAGSDAHQPAELCTVYTEIQAGLNIDEILRAIKKGLVRTPPPQKSIHF
ncbi:MAG: CehA/McbA family metallohydrolase [Candidatus Bathyarchaeia archaeon]